LYIRNVSERLAGDVQTNQRAELTAIKIAFEMTKHIRSIIIYTDSKYSRSCVLEWAPNWARNQWKTSTGVDVKNRDLVEAIVKLLGQRNRAGYSTDIIWVKAHESCHGNICADRLAVQGARKPPVAARQPSPDFVVTAADADDDEDVFEDALDNTDDLYAFAAQ
jgi:ribonuclease HI